MEPSVLAYTPDPGEAAECARRIGPGAWWADSPAAALPYLDRTEVLFCWGFPGELLARMPRLRWIQKMGAGVDDLVPWLDPGGGVALTRLGGVFGGRMAEYVLAYVLALCQDVPGVLARSRDRDWRRFRPRRAAGRVLGVAGTGAAGSAIARAAAAVGLRPVGWRRRPGPVAGFERTYAGGGGLPAFLARCEFLVLALPHTPETAGRFGARELALLPAGAVLINVGRGAALDLPALAAALEAGHLAAAVLDVLPEEPPAPGSPVWSLPRCILTPHVAGPNSPEEVVPPFLENLRRHRAGEALLDRVDLARGY